MATTLLEGEARLAEVVMDQAHLWRLAGDEEAVHRISLHFLLITLRSALHSERPVIAAHPVLDQWEA